MRIRTLTPLAVLFVGLAVLGCETGDDVDTLDDATEEPVMQDDMDEGMMDDTMEDTTMVDTTMADTAMAEGDGAAIEE